MTTLNFLSILFYYCYTLLNLLSILYNACVYVNKLVVSKNFKASCYRFILQIKRLRKKSNYKKKKNTNNRHSFRLENTPREISSWKSLTKIVAPYASTPLKCWRKSRDILVDELFRCYNETVFNGKVNLTASITIQYYTSNGSLSDLLNT